VEVKVVISVSVVSYSDGIIVEICVVTSEDVPSSFSIVFVTISVVEIILVSVCTPLGRVLVIVEAETSGVNVEVTVCTAFPLSVMEPSLPSIVLVIVWTISVV